MSRLRARGYFGSAFKCVVIRPRPLHYQEELGGEATSKWLKLLEGAKSLEGVVCALAFVVLKILKSLMECSAWVSLHLYQAELLVFFHTWSCYRGTCFGLFVL